MLIYPDSSSLGDKYLSPTEALSKIKEDNKKLTAPKRLPQQDLLEKHDMAVGTPMSPSIFIEKLRTLPNVIVEQGGLPNAVAVRTIITDGDKTSPTYGMKVKKYISGFYTDRVLPEFSSIVNDQHGLPTREIRGWRTVLLQLYHSKTVSYALLKKVFGEPHGQRNTLWMEQTQVGRQ